VYLGYIGVFLDDAFKISMSRERETRVQISAKLQNTHGNTHTLPHFLSTLAIWTTNYIIFKNVETFKKLFLPNQKIM
jgi:hypothetical protein